MIVAFFILVLCACYVCLTRDSGALKYLVLIGFLQDPIRKLMVNEPVYMTVVVGVIAGCAFVRQLFSERLSVVGPYLYWNKKLIGPLAIFFVILAVQFFHSLLRYGSPIVPMLGAIFYVAPFVAISLGYAQFPRFDEMRKFLVIHITLAIVVAITVLLSFMGYDHSLFNEVGAGLTIYDQGTILKAHSGLMRSSEVAGWHLGAGICFMLILAVSRNSLPSVLFTAVAVVLILSAIILTGRRKMIFQVIMFGVLYFPFLHLYQKRLATGYFVTAGVVVGVAFLAAMWVFPLVSNAEFELYLMRGSSVFGDATDRFSSFGLGSMGWAIDQFGIFGGGLGVAAQGVHHFGGAIAGGAAEGGLGKISSELGAVSLVVIFWLLLAMVVHVHRCVSLVARTMPEYLAFTVGVAVFIVSNIPTFMVASQVFGDVFILLIIGLMIGFLFAIPSLVISSLKKRDHETLKSILSAK